MTTILLIVGIAGIFMGVFLSLAAVGVFTNEARGVSKSLAVVEAFSAAPQSMRAELDPSFNERVLNPLLNRLVGIGKRLTPNDYAERLSKKLDVAGNPEGWTVDRIVSLKVVGIGAGILVAVLVGLTAQARIAPEHPVLRSGCGRRLLRPEPVALPEGV